MLYTMEDKQQVRVKIDGVPSVCTGDCTFEQSEADTPLFKAQLHNGTSLKGFVLSPKKIVGTPLLQIANYTATMKTWTELKHFAVPQGNDMVMVNKEEKTKTDFETQHKATQQSMITAAQNEETPAQAQIQEYTQQQEGDFDGLVECCQSDVGTGDCQNIGSGNQAIVQGDTWFEKDGTKYPVWDDGRCGGRIVQVKQEFEADIIKTSEGVVAGDHWSQINSDGLGDARQLNKNKTGIDLQVTQSSTPIKSGTRGGNVLTVTGKGFPDTVDLSKQETKVEFIDDKG